MKKYLFLLLMCTSGLAVQAQVMWNLRGGLMQREYKDRILFGEDESNNREKRIDWMAGLEMEIPLSDMLNIETGLRYKNHYSAVKAEDVQRSWYDTYTVNYYKTASSHIELPLRLAYKQQLGKYFSLHAGVGPYASYAIGDDFGDKWNNNLQVGLEPSVVINWACLSLGATYNIPCFYEGFKDENKPVVMATLGIRFRSHVWKYVGATLLAIASVGAAAAAVWPSGDYSSYSSSSYGSSYNNGSYNSFSVNASSGNGNAETGTHSSSSASGNKYNLGEQQNYNTDKQIWSNYDGMLSAHFYGGRSATRNEIKQWQQKMKDLRARWKAKGKSFPDSSNENKSTSNCPNTSHSH